MTKVLCSKIEIFEVRSFFLILRVFPMGAQRSRCRAAAAHRLKRREIGQEPGERAMRQPGRRRTVREGVGQPGKLGATY